MVIVVLLMVTGVTDGSGSDACYSDSYYIDSGSIDDCYCDGCDITREYGISCGDCDVITMIYFL